ncbi:DMT family transporter [Vibrio furnissii]|uniref:DMT family transporter n=1 Tax=Vibrio furnissii TaxID=29494 RepID=UPI001EEB3EE7|nr:DMT family transporter [Vibrio furnissii]MCG6216827.1 DMT family transporter [Vibrio furnissii]
MLVKMIPFVFVMLWASGFVGARFGLAYAEPMTFLTLRMVFNVLLFAGLIAVLKRRVPTGKSFWHSCVTGLLIHGLYLGGTYQAIYWGMPAGLTSLLVGIQPILTALLLVCMATERLNLAQWVGLGLGFAGISCVLLGNMEWRSDAHQWAAIGMCLISLRGITLGTLYQKKFCQGVDLIGGALVQYVAAAAVLIPAAFSFETMQVDWTPTFIMTLAWLVVVLSCIAILLLLYMVEHGASSSVASVFYLVPPTTALQAWLCFGESFDVLGVLGFAMAAMAVYLVVKKPVLLRRNMPVALRQDS